MTDLRQVPFNRPCLTGQEASYVLEALQSSQLSGDGPFSRRCQDWLKSKLDVSAAYLTPSCTHALEMAAILLDIQPGDEVIMPSYTFVSTANAFALRGARIVFVDIRPDTLNLDVGLLEAAITSRTRALVPVHYAGVACELEPLMELAKAYGLYVVEDAAQGLMSQYQNRYLGSWGHLAAFSFHETKNLTSGGEGGALIVNASEFQARAEIIREKGTNRSQFFRGMVDKYSWVDLGSSYLPSELQAAYLWAQLTQAEEITQARLQVWQTYADAFAPLMRSDRVEMPEPPADCLHNGHIFYLKVRDLEERSAFLAYLKQQGVQAVFHYVPLHSAPAGKELGHFSGQDKFTTRESERLIRLPLYYGISEVEIRHVIQAVYQFFEQT